MVRLFPVWSVVQSSFCGYSDRTVPVQSDTKSNVMAPYVRKGTYTGAGVCQLRAKQSPALRFANSRREDGMWSSSPLSLRYTGVIEWTIKHECDPCWFFFGLTANASPASPPSDMGHNLDRYRSQLVHSKLYGASPGFLQAVG